MPEARFPGIRLLGTQVNKGKKEGQGPSGLWSLRSLTDFYKLLTLT